MCKKYYVYVDWTLEECPRPFYVGKGVHTRVLDEKRNIVHERIKLKYGLQRRIVFETDDEREAFDVEIKLIKEHKTYLHGDGCWGSNLTLGGEGAAGHVVSNCAREELRRISLELWKNHEYIVKNTSPAPIDVGQLANDGNVLCWDDIATKYNVSSTTVKKWFKQLGLVKNRNVHSRRKSWSSDESEQLMKLYESGMLVRDIASLLCRRECSIKKRIQKLCIARKIKRYRYRRSGIK